MIASLESRLTDAIAALQAADAALDHRVLNNGADINNLQISDSLQSQQITTIFNTGQEINTAIASLGESLETLAASPIFDLE